MSRFLSWSGRFSIAIAVQPLGCFLGQSPLKEVALDQSSPAFLRAPQTAAARRVDNKPVSSLDRLEALAVDRPPRCQTHVARRSAFSSQTAPRGMLDPVESGAKSE